jgi:hypothetical protein
MTTHERRETDYKHTRTIADINHADILRAARDHNTRVDYAQLDRTHWRIVDTSLAGIRHYHIPHELTRQGLR